MAERMTQLLPQLPPAMEEALDALNTYHRDQFTKLAHDESRKRPRERAPELNLDLLMRDLSRGNLNGANREALEESARRDGISFDPVRPYVALRDLTKASGPSAGFLVATEVQDSLDILRPWSVMARAGMQIELGLVGEQTIPKVTAKSTPNWLTTETTQATGSIPTLAQIGLTAKHVAGFLQYSRQFSKQTNAPRFVARELLKTVGTAIDQAVINGSGASGQPLGLLNTAGIVSQSGTTLNSGVFTMKQKSAEANATDEKIAFLSTPAVRQLLETRERATGGGRFVWQNDQLADRAAYVTTDMPTATMICGDFGLIYLGFWGAGVYLEINPYDSAGFKSGIIQARVLVSCDVAVLQPAAFVVASSIT